MASSYLAAQAKKAKSSSRSSAPKALRIIDHDVRIQPKLQTEEDEEEKPVVVGEVEEKRPASYSVGLKEDGSGWTVVSGPSSSKKQSKRHDSDQDLSPQRTQDLSPPRRRHDADLSPPRKRHDADLSPPRKRHDADLSPPRKRHDADLSPPRKRHDRDSEGSRKHRDSTARSDSRNRSPSPKRRRHESESRGHDTEGKRHETEGKRHGLLSGAEVAREAAKQIREQEARFAKVDPKALGKGAETVYRDKRGKKLSINEIIRQEEGKANDEDDLEWGTGLAQKRLKEERRAYEESQKDKPFAQLPDDPDLDNMYKDKNRWGDPLAHLASKKKAPQEKGKKVAVSERRWRGHPPLNRFNILPGNKWDGVDRSNGFENKYLSKEGNKVARNEEAYLWSVEDM